MDFAGAQFYCLHALADGSQRIRLREKTLEFFSTVSFALSGLRTLVTEKNNVSDTPEQTYALC